MRSLNRPVLGALACGLLVAASAPAARAQSGKADASAAAVIAGKPVSLAEIDARITKSNTEFAQELYNARKAALDDLILEQFLQADAASKGVPVEEYIQQRINETAAPVTDAEVEAFFKQNEARMQGRTLEQMSGQIKDYLKGPRQATAKNALLKELKEKNEVRIMLDPPRMTVTLAANDPVKGPASAPITIVEFSEFQCPFCSRVGPTLKQIQETYGDKVRIAFRDYILPMHNRAKPAAEAAQCANEQGKFWEFHDGLFANQQKLSDDDFKNLATSLGLDMEKFNACYGSNKYRADVEADMAEGAKLGVKGTPAFFVNGRFLSGAQPFDAFKAIIDEELAR